MVRTIKAKFANGVFEPLEPTVLAEVMITISTPSDRPADDPLRGTSGGLARFDRRRRSQTRYLHRSADRDPPTRRAVNLAYVIDTDWIIDHSMASSRSPAD